MSAEAGLIYYLLTIFLIGFISIKIVQRIDELERSIKMAQHKPTRTKRSGNGTKVKGK